MKKNNKIFNLILPLLSILLIFIIWIVASRIVDNNMVLPTVSETFSSLFSLLVSGSFYYSFLMTFLRSLISFAISFVLAFAVAFLSFKSEKVFMFFKPLIAIIRALPTIAVVLLILLWVNTFFAPIIVTALVVFPTLFTNIYVAFKSLDHKQLTMCKFFNVSKKDILLKVEIPQIAPALFSSIGSGISLNLKLMVAAEVLSATANSIGNMLNGLNSNLEIANMLAVVLFSVLVGIIIENIFEFISKKAGSFR